METFKALNSLIIATGYLLREHQNYLIRLCITLSFLLIMPWLNSEPFDFSIGNPIFAVISGYILLNTALIFLNLNKVLTDKQLRYATIVADTSGITLLLIIGGSSASPICAAYYILIAHIGNSAKSRELLVSSSLSTLGFTTALLLSSYWNTHFYLGIGLVLGLLLTSLILYREITLNLVDEGSYEKQKSVIRNTDKNDHSDLKLLLLTNDSKDRHLLLSHIESWGINANIYNSSLRAFAELVNHAENNDEYTTIIVDSLNIDMDPIQFAKYIRLDSSLSNTHLIHVAPEHSIEHKKQLLDAGYTTLLTTPVDKTVLFDALHNNKAHINNHKNITQLINHYSSKYSVRQPLDILLAVENKAEQELFHATLERQEQRVYTVSSGSQALDALHTHQFDLVILDFNMSDIEGKEIIRLYNYTYPNEEWAPFIALVDEATTEVMSQCREAEVNAILVRPVMEKELLITVADIASSKTKQAESIDKHWQPPHIHETQIRDSDNQILNTKTLLQLQELSSSKKFLSLLTTKFNQDMDILMDEMELSIHNNCFTDFKDSAYALKDSSCNLGADSLHNLSLLALQINQREFQSEARRIFKEIQQTLSKTKYALQIYATKQESSASESE